MPTGMTRSFGKLVSDPGMEPRVRRALDRFSRPYLWVDNQGAYLDDEGRVSIRLNGTTLSQTADGVRVNPSGSPVVAGLTITGFNGFLYASNGVVAAATNLCTLLTSSGTTTGNTAATETDLFSYTVPANTLSTDGSCLEFTAAGTISSTAAVDKRLRVKLGSTTIVDPLAFSASVPTSWSVTGTILRTGATTQRIAATIVCGDIVLNTGAMSAKSEYSTASETLANALALKVTGIGTNANDVVGTLWKVVKQSA